MGSTIALLRRKVREGSPEQSRADNQVVIFVFYHTDMMIFKVAKLQRNFHISQLHDVFIWKSDEVCLTLPKKQNWTYVRFQQEETAGRHTVVQSHQN